MGITYAEIELINTGDVIMARRGKLGADEVRRMKVRALVDSGSFMLCVPEHVVLQLRLEETDSREMELADGSLHNVPIVGPVDIRFENRRTTMPAAKLGNEVLLGAIPMQDMDVVIDPRQERLIVNPENPTMPKMKIK